MLLPYKEGSVLMTSPYGMRGDSMHYGVDLVGTDKNITAVYGGKVTRSQFDDSWGNYVAVESGDGSTRYYCHLSERLKSAGEKVIAGDVIGIEGSTGNSTGSHLHYEVRRGNEKLNAADDVMIPNVIGNYPADNVTHYIESLGAICEYSPGTVQLMKEFNHPFRYDYWRKLFNAVNNRV